jgi:hypothetical protein
MRARSPRPARAWRTDGLALVAAGKRQQHPLLVGLDALLQDLHLAVASRRRIGGEVQVLEAGTALDEAKSAILEPSPWPNTA